MVVEISRALRNAADAPAI